MYDKLATIPVFNEDEETASGGPSAVRDLRRLVAEADGLLISTPEYNQSIPGVLKNVVDWLSRPGPEEVLIDKPIAILGATAGRWGTRLAQSMLRHTLCAAEALVLPKPMIFVREAARLFDESGQLRYPPLRDELTAFLLAFSRWMERVGPAGVSA